MDLKEFMRQKADEEFSSGLSESDKEYCKQLEADYPVELVKYRRKYWACFFCAAAILVAAIIIIYIIFAPDRSPLRYQGEKNTVASTIIELNKDTNYFETNTKENTLCEVRMNYDVESGDKLYYEMSLDGLLETAQFVFVINLDFEYEFEKPIGQELKEKLDGYELNYIIGSASALDSTQYYAWIKLNTETIYITYTQVAPLGDQAFFDYVQSVIKAK